MTRRDRDRHHLLCALCVLTPIGQNTGQEEIKADLRMSRERRGAVVRAQVHVGIAERPVGLLRFRRLKEPSAHQ